MADVVLLLHGRIGRHTVHLRHFFMQQLQFIALGAVLLLVHKLHQRQQLVHKLRRLRTGHAHRHLRIRTHFFIHPQLALAQIVDPALQRFKLDVFLLNKTTGIQRQLLHFQTGGNHIFDSKIHLSLPHHAPRRLNGIVRFADDGRWPILLHRLHRLLRLRLCLWRRRSTVHALGHRHFSHSRRGLRGFSLLRRLLRRFATRHQHPRTQPHRHIPFHRPLLILLSDAAG